MGIESEEVGEGGADALLLIYEIIRIKVLRELTASCA